MWAFDQLALPLIRVGDNQGQGQPGGVAMGDWREIGAPIGPIGCCSVHHSHQLFQLFHHSGHLAFIYIDCFLKFSFIHFFLLAKSLSPGIC